ncbi:MAG: type II secretion system protein M [Pseudomonadota bacterium]
MIGTWWNGLEAREKQLILIAGVLSAVIGLYQLILVPSLGFADSQQQRYRAALSEQADVRAAAAQARTTAAPETANQPLQSVLTNTAGLYGLTITRLAPAENDGLNLWFDGVPPQILYAWIGDLERAHGVRVGKASLRNDPEGGTISANFYMARTG